MPREFQRTIAFIAGSGLAKGLEGVLEEVHKKSIKVPAFGIEEVKYFVGLHGNTRVVILPRHGEPKDGNPEFSPAELVRTRRYEANIWALHTLGVEAVYGFSAVGVLDTYTPLADSGTFIVPHTYIRGLAASQHSFGSNATVIHTPMREPFNAQLRAKAIHAIRTAEHTARDTAVYIYNGGDCFETPDEICCLDNYTRPLKELYPEKELDRVVGMTTVPEAILLAQVGIPFAVICSNVNYAEGLSPATIVSHEQTLSVMGRSEKYLISIARKIIELYS